MEHIIGTGKLNSIPIGYNPFSAMPSLHMAWAIIVSVTLIVLARPLLFKILGVIYPLVMFFTVVVTGNHYIVDAAGAALVVGCAAMLTLGLERLFRMWRERRGAEMLQASP